MSEENNTQRVQQPMTERIRTALQNGDFDFGITERLTATVNSKKRRKIFNRRTIEQLDPNSAGGKLASGEVSQGVEMINVQLSLVFLLPLIVIGEIILQSFPILQSHGHHSWLWISVSSWTKLCTYLSIVLALLVFGIFLIMKALLLIGELGYEISECKKMIRALVYGQILMFINVFFIFIAVAGIALGLVGSL